MLLVPAWLIMGALAFTLIRLIPGDPAAVLLGMEATPQAVAELRTRLGLDRPLPVQVMAVKRRDYPLVQGCLLLISTVVIVVNLAVAVLYAWLDPQIRYG